MISMNIYYDNLGNIKGIVPDIDKDLSTEYKSAIITSDLIDDFLRGKKSLNNYLIKENKTPLGINCTIVKKIININITRTLDNYLTKIDNTSLHSIINVYNTGDNIKLELSQNYIDLYKSGDDEQIKIISDFIKNSQSNIYITEKNNPYNLYKTISFLPNTLFENVCLYFKCDKRYKNTSAYTKKIVPTYKYVEKE